MLVYGDRRQRVPAGYAVEAAIAALRRAEADEDDDALDGTRRAVIAVGRLEQAVDDLAVGDPPGGAPIDAALVRSATDAAARAFTAAWARTQPPGSGPEHPITRLTASDVVGALVEARSVLHAVRTALGDVADAELTVTTPEGFASYALLPDQYAAAALAWCTAIGSLDRPCAVIGVRSIGTTLSAVVAAALSATDTPVARTTVRPTGDPYERVVEIDLAAPAADAVDRGWSLVVDEGPGRSGSSMAAVVDALRRSGARADRIVLLPAHDAGPGPEASDRIREVWRTTERVVVPASTLRWSGLDLGGVLATRAVRLGGSDPVGPDARPSGDDVDVEVQVEADVEDLAGGRWRAHALAEPSRWPAVATAFERPARRCSGGALDRPVLWRFAGVDADAVVERWQRSAMHRWRPECIGAVWGFVGTRWIDGEALTTTDLDQRVLGVLTDHLLDSAGAPVPGLELIESVERLGAVIERNVGLALGPAAVERIQLDVARARHVARGLADGGRPPASATDGRTEPHGWVRDRTGRLWKVDGFGPEHDHTVAGAQPLVWDVAGVVLAWDLDDLDDLRRRALVARVAADHPDLMLAGWLRFHELARAALDLGRWTMSAPGADPADGERSARAAARATATLARLVDRGAESYASTSSK